MMLNSNINFKKQRLRSFFLAFENDTQVQKEIVDIEDRIESEGLTYIQMRLPVSKITAKFDNDLKEKVEKNILQAKIRESTEKDLASVMYLYNRSWMVSNTPFSPINIESLKIIFDFPKTLILIAKVYGSDAGFVILDFEGDYNEIGIIAGLGVLPRFQRKGLGTVLGMAAWNYFKEREVKELRCEVYVNNLVSYNFISSLGFEEFERKTYKKEDFS